MPIAGPHLAPLSLVTWAPEYKVPKKPRGGTEIFGHKDSENTPERRGTVASSCSGLALCLEITQL